MPYIYIPSKRLRKEIIYLIVLFVLFIAGAIYLYTQQEYTPAEGVRLFVIAVGCTVIVYGLFVLVRYVIYKILDALGYPIGDKDHKIHVIHRPSSSKKSKSEHHHHHHHHHHSQD